MSSAQAALGQDGLDCDPAVSRRTWPASTCRSASPPRVTATVTCQVPLSDLLLPGMPGSRTLTATFTSPLDPFRGR